MKYFILLVCFLFDKYLVLQAEREIYDKLRQILSGKESIKLFLDFLKKNNRVDMQILKASKVGRHKYIK